MCVCVCDGVYVCVSMFVWKEGNQKRRDKDSKIILHHFSPQYIICNYQELKRTLKKLQKET